MKQKIEEAIEQGYKNLGVPKTVIGGLAALGLTVVKDESEIAAFVQSEAVKGVMKSYQSEADKVRTEYSAKLKGLETEKAELEAKLNGNQPTDPTKQTEDESEISKLVKLMQEQNEQMRKQNEALTARLDAIDATRAKETAVAALDKLCAEWDYAQGFPKERDEAKRIALKVYKAGGEQMTGEELVAAFREEFDPAVKNKGVTDFSKPFQSDGGAGGDDADFSAFDKAAEKLGWTEPEKK